jgi:hypothetical protein
MSAGPHRRYTHRQKATAVIAAEMASLAAASEKSGIPRTTLQHWMADPALGELRRKTREELAEDAMRLAHLAYTALAHKIMDGEVEGRDLVTAYGVAIDKGQLLSGAATQRTEHRDLTEILPDHEKEALADAIDAWIKERDLVDAG